jgi:hypothetical protein
MGSPYFSCQSQWIASGIFADVRLYGSDSLRAVRQSFGFVTTEKNETARGRVPPNSGHRQARAEAVHLKLNESFLRSLFPVRPIPNVALARSDLPRKLLLLIIWLRAWARAEESSGCVMHQIV